MSKTYRHALSTLIARIVLIGAALLILTPVTSQAIPAYARAYNVSCTVCHSPQPPQLNNVGMVFMRSGFRLPDADDNGKLILKSAPAKGISDFASLAAELNAHRDQSAEPGQNRATMELGEVQIVAGAPIGEHLSAQAIYLLRNDEGEQELEQAQVQWNQGPPERQWTARAGVIPTFIWQKANHEVLTLSTPLAFSEEALAGVGDFGGFALGTKQTGLEVGYMISKLNNGKLRSTMLAGSIFNGVLEDGSRADHNNGGGFDWMVQGVHLFGSRNTVGAFYYDGRATIDAAGELDPPGPYRDRFTRFGLLGNYAPLDWLNIAGSIVTGKDKSDQLGASVTTLGGYAEAEFKLKDHWIAIYRWDRWDPNRDVSGDTITAQTVATTWQAEDHLFLTLEYDNERQTESNEHSWIGSVRLIY